MTPMQWQVMATRNGRQVPLFVLPDALGLTTPAAAQAVALEILVGRSGAAVNGTIMDHALRVYDLETLRPLNG